MKSAEDIKKEFMAQNGLRDEDVMFDEYLFKEQARAEAICAACQGSKECQLSPAHYRPHLSWDGRVEQTYEACPYARPLGAITLQNLSIESFQGPLDITPARAAFLKYRKDLLARVKAHESALGLYLYGPYGTGKTYLVLRLARELASLGARATVLYYPDFAREVFQAMKEGTLEREMNTLKEIDVLVLDDIGAENNTAYLRDEILVPILQTRMNARRLTIMTSNLDYDTLKEHFASTKDSEDVVKSARLVSWIASMTIAIPLSGKDYRKDA